MTESEGCGRKDEDTCYLSVSMKQDGTWELVLCDDDGLVLRLASFDGLEQKDIFIERVGDGVKDLDCVVVMDLGVTPACEAVNAWFSKEFGNNDRI